MSDTEEPDPMLRLFTDQLARPEMSATKTERIRSLAHAELRTGSALRGKMRGLYRGCEAALVVAFGAIYLLWAFDAVLLVYR